MKTMTGAVTFFELGVEDAKKGRAFYEGLFGWEFETGPSGNGWVISTPGRARRDAPRATPARRRTSSSPSRTWTPRSSA